MKQIFSKSASYIASRAIIFIVLTLVIIVLDTRTGLFKPLRQKFMSVSVPLYWSTSLPGRVGEWASQVFTSRDALLAENEKLHAENFILQQELQTMAALVAENARLNELLNASKRVEGKVLIANLIGISPDLRRQEMVVDKGSDDAVRIGQTVLDADGLVGQVIEVAARSSRVLLIVDSESAVPVQVVRNGVRAIAEGSGEIGEMRLRYVTATADIVVGDVLVSSGLDKHYPPNYPAAKVVAVERDAGQPFMNVRSLPLAQLNRSRHFLIVSGRGG